MRAEGGWLFISHSHLDIDIVRKIRNQLEEQGFEPLIFYLKCLNDDDEIESLIQREINEREWFIYVESENAAKSRWVQSERAYISQLSGKKVFTININDDISEQINNITKQLKVFISYSHKDRAIYELIKQALLSRDFLVFDDRDIPANVNWTDKIRTEIDESAKNGFVLLLITENMKNSFYIRQEIEYTRAVGGKIIPIYIGNTASDLARELRIPDIQGVHLDNEPTKEQIDAIIPFLEKNINAQRMP